MKKPSYLLVILTRKILTNNAIIATMEMPVQLLVIPVMKIPAHPLVIPAFAGMTVMWDSNDL